jgi:hypothetical protein
MGTTACLFLANLPSEIEKLDWLIGWQVRNQQLYAFDLMQNQENGILSPI